MKTAILQGEGVRKANAEEQKTIEAALEAARRRGDEVLAKLFDGRSMLTAEAFAGKIGVSLEELAEMTRAERVIKITNRAGEVRYPTNQLATGGANLLPGVSNLLAIIRKWGGYDPNIRAWQFLDQFCMGAGRRGRTIARKDDVRLMEAIFENEAHGGFA